MIESRVPNLFIIGAPKCGTTAMSHYLAGHPDVFMSEQSGIKEPHFFSRDITWWDKGINTREDYLKLFENAPDTVTYVGEASPTYLYSQVAVKDILSISPNAKFIVMLRNPIDLVQSFHNQHIKTGAENIIYFEDAWHAQKKRREGYNLPAWDNDPEAFQYGERGLLGKYTKKLLATTPLNRVYFIVYDDFEYDPKGTYIQLLDFLGLPFDKRTDFQIINSSMEYKSKALELALLRVRTLRDNLGIPGGFGIHKMINKFNLQPKLKHSTNSLEPAFEVELRQYFKEDIELLSQTLNRDFNSWLY